MKVKRPLCVRLVSVYEVWVRAIIPYSLIDISKVLESCPIPPNTGMENGQNLGLNRFFK